jgi:hypothetical protein
MGVAYKCDRCKELCEGVKSQPFITQRFKTSNEHKLFGFWGDSDELEHQLHHSIARISLSNQGDYNDEGDLKNADYCMDCWTEVMLCLVRYLDVLFSCEEKGEGK